MAQAERELQPGEPVAWSYGAGQARGHVVGKITEDKKIGSRVFKASPGDPKYVVKSDSSGKEAVKKPETLHKVDEGGDADGEGEDEDEDARSEGEKVKTEAYAKEKRDDLNARVSSEERKEAEREESLKKVQDTGKGPVRASAKAARNKIKNVAKGDDIEEDVEEEDDIEEDLEEEDATYEPDKSDLQVHDDEKILETLPSENEALAASEETRKEGTKVVDDSNFIVDDDTVEDEDETYEPGKGEDTSVAADEVINTLPPHKIDVKDAEG